MTAPPDVVDVVPPDHLPPVRPRSRVKSVLLVLVAFVVTCSLGFIPAASAAGPLVLVPVAKGVGAVAAGVLTEQAFDAMWNGTGDKPGDDDNSESAKKGRGKWGQRLQGLRDIGAGLLGALFGIDGLMDGDGIEMPEDFKDDVLRDDTPGSSSGWLRNWTLEDVTWVRGYALNGGGSAVGPAFKAQCETVYTGSLESRKCSDPYQQRNIASSYVSAEYECYHPIVGEYLGFASVAMNEYRSPWSLNGGSNGPCGNNALIGGGGGQIKAVTLKVPEQSRYDDGLRNPGRYVNPNFDFSQLDQTGPTVTAETVCGDGEGQYETVTKTVAGVDVMPLARCPAGMAPLATSWTKNSGRGDEWLGGMETKTPEGYPDCPPGRCVRIITVDDVPCRVGVAECYDWQNVQPPSRVKCEYGPYQMPIADCADLAHIHKTTHGVTPDTRPENDPQRQPGWLPANPDGTVDWTRVGSDPRPDDNPNPDYRPPVRGPIVSAPTLPDTELPPLPDPPTAPMPPTVSVPNPPGNPKDPDNPTKNCMGGMASWNPVDWIYTPVKCALTWAFVPPNGSGPSLIGDFRAKVLTAELGAWLAIPDDLFGSLPEGSGCMGPPLNMPEPLGGKTYYPLNACSEPMAKYANMSRSLITIVVVFYGMFSIVNSLTVAMTGYRMFDRETASLAKQVG